MKGCGLWSTYSLDYAILFIIDNNALIGNGLIIRLYLSDSLIVAMTSANKMKKKYKITRFRNSRRSTIFEYKGNFSTVCELYNFFDRTIHTEKCKGEYSTYAYYFRTQMLEFLLLIFIFNIISRKCIFQILCA